MISAISTLFPYTTLFRSLDDDVCVYPAEAKTRDAGDRIGLTANLLRLQSNSHAIVHLIEDRVWTLAAHVWANNTLAQDRKSTRLNSSHVKISYAVFCLKK